MSGFIHFPQNKSNIDLVWIIYFVLNHYENLRIFVCEFSETPMLANSYYHTHECMQYNSYIYFMKNILYTHRLIHVLL
jgi:hypothetical protein